MKPVVDAVGSQKPVPVPDAASAPFWEAARQHRLVVQRCEACGRDQYPPDLICRRCQSNRLSFVDAVGGGVIYSFAVYVRSFMSGFEAPYVLALVDLESHSVRMLANIVDTPIPSISVGMPVEVTFEDRGEWVVPQFRAVRS
ncbi:MAG TPA: OB-fold domain-containing protein [Candidatus Dormibacteraeota bacterium]